ncbi:LysR substrate-binding domain-containing protein [Novosphingobium sp. B 225]|jgi:DNA-binding transcriptional LysR family regulator|uniref:LysR substrate-binding domain-containing protein n=1 Tax=Novosphingobium sp. B 225 TaxID=1961849 RepID=UPI000B4A7822|nr:LysR substrate-binding domain-containing protein [Novosphingobium sp. B 225]
MHRLRHLLGPLRVFDAVYRSGGISRGAEALHVTPGAVSQQIKQLEAMLGVLLVRKAGREIELTEAGLILAKSLSDLFDRIDAVLDEVTEAGNPKRLRLKVLPTFAIKWLVPRLASFYAAHSDIDIEIATVSKAQELQLDNADFVVRHGTGEWPGLHVDHLFDEVFVPVCSPAMAETIAAPEDLLEAQLLHSMMRPEGWPTWLSAAGLGTAQPTRNVTLANAALCVQAAVNGLGVAIAQKAYVRDDLASGRLVHPLEQEVPTEFGYYLLCDPAKADAQPVKLFREWLLSEAD